MADDRSPLEIISEIQDLIDLHDFMEDERINEALSVAIKCQVDPKVPNEKVAPLIVRLSAYAALFRAQYAYHMSRGTADRSNHKKNIYRSMYEGIDNLVDSLKKLLI